MKNKITPTQETVDLYWGDNRIQYPRLIAEIVANVHFSAQDFQRLENSMDLRRNEIIELMERSQTEWEQIKKGKITFLTITKGI